ncbi:MAG: tRNA pseudouridine(55) synthase TruB [Flavobacteriaceae bacterium]|nr:tRNA pseudouridine(55) synthase TruB [Flavobacteriaceae bacterium]
MKTLEDFRAGELILIDKPFGWTSFQVVNKIRWVICKHFKIKKLKVGHAGTLDPLATGLLILCTGKMTKKIELYQGMPKAYSGSMKLGSTTPSFDLETDIDKTFSTEHINEELIHQTAEIFKGEIDQIPPIYSAVKQGGKRLYKIAREGKEIEIKTRRVQIDKFRITKIEALTLHFDVVCSKGTYIRSLVHDFGKALNSGAHLTSLRRVAIGNYQVNDAMDIEEFIGQLKES